MSERKRLIDANEIEKLFYNQIELGATDLMDAFDYALEDAQTVDAVEVVRCNGCKYYRGGDEGGCYLLRYHTFDEPTVTADDYCSFGERKDDDR